jgi:sarcosine oxidase
MADSPLLDGAASAAGRCGRHRACPAVTGFEAAFPAHGRSAVGGNTRLIRMLNRLPRLLARPGRLPQPLGRTQSPNGPEHPHPQRPTLHPHSQQPLHHQPPGHHRHQRAQARNPQRLGNGRMATPSQRNLRLDDNAIYDRQDSAPRTDQAATAAAQAQLRNHPHQHTHRQHQRNQRQRRRHLLREVSDFRGRHHLLRRLVPAAYGPDHSS